MLSPKHNERHGQEAIATKPNGTGPFKLVSWSKNEEAGARGERELLARRAEGEGVVVRPILEDAARIAALQAGEVDLIAPGPHVRSPSCSATTSW